MGVVAADLPFVRIAVIQARIDRRIAQIHLLSARREFRFRDNRGIAFRARRIKEAGYAIPRIDGGAARPFPRGCGGVRRPRPRVGCGARRPVPRIGRRAGRPIRDVSGSVRKPFSHILQKSALPFGACGLSSH